MRAWGVVGVASLLVVLAGGGAAIPHPPGDTRHIGRMFMGTPYVGIWPCGQGPPFAPGPLTFIPPTAETIPGFCEKYDGWSLAIFNVTGHGGHPFRLFATKALTIQHNLNVCFFPASPYTSLCYMADGDDYGEIPPDSTKAAVHLWEGLEVTYVFEY